MSRRVATSAPFEDNVEATRVVAFALNDDSTVLGGVIVSFLGSVAAIQSVAQEIAGLVRDGASDFLLSRAVSDAEVRIEKSIRLDGGGRYFTYVHHNGKSGAAVEILGEGDEEIFRKIAIQVVAFPPEVLQRNELSQGRLETEYEIEERRALNEGLSLHIAERVARSRLEKDFVRSVVLLEQPLYTEPSKSVGVYLAETAPTAEVKSFTYLSAYQ